jgi:Putative Actinobacterial Holin-X, holin superfamily III
VTATSPPNGAIPSGRHAADPTVGQLVADASASLSTLLHGEIELAKLELRSSVKNAGVGIGFFGAAVVVLVFSLIFGFIAFAEGLVAAGLWRWVAYLVVFALQLTAVGLSVFLGIRKVKRVRAPERTIATSKDTIAYLKANTKRS